MYNSRMSIGSRARQTSGFKVSLGNNTTRYNSEVAIERKKYFTSSRYRLFHLAKIVKMSLTGCPGHNLTISEITNVKLLCSRILVVLSSKCSKPTSMLVFQNQLTLKVSLTEWSSLAGEIHGRWKIIHSNWSGLDLKARFEKNNKQKDLNSRLDLKWVATRLEVVRAANNTRLVVSKCPNTVILRLLFTDKKTLQLKLGTHTCLTQLMFNDCHSTLFYHYLLSPKDIILLLQLPLPEDPDAKKIIHRQTQ